MKKMSNKVKAAVYTALVVVAFVSLVIAVTNRNTLGNVLFIIWLSALAMAIVGMVYNAIETGIELNEPEREYKEREKKIDKRLHDDRTL